MDNKEIKAANFVKMLKESNSDFYEDPREELVKQGIYYITGGIDTDSLLFIHQDILLKHRNPMWRDEVQIIVNSYGGDVAETWALIDLLDWVKMDVRTVAMGYCASAGACLACCGTHGKRIMSPNATIMVHGAKAGAYGGVDQVLAIAKDLQNEHEKDIKFWIQHSKYTRRDKIEKVFLGKADNFFTAEEALKHGIVDVVIIGKALMNNESKQ